MIGIVVATHGDLGRSLIAAMEMILGEQPQVSALSLQVSDRLEDAAERLEAAAAEADGGEGILILTDMLGGTPSNMSLALLGGSRPVEVVSGANLPMLLKAAQGRHDLGLAEIAALAKRQGRSAIVVASEVLAGGEREGERA